MDNLNSHVAGDDGEGSASKEKPGHWWATDYGIRDRRGYICQIIVPSSFQGQEERHEREVAERASAIRLMTTAPELWIALKEARRVIDSMKQEAETAAQLDGQAMLEACGEISRQGLAGTTAIRRVLEAAGCQA